MRESMTLPYSNNAARKTFSTIGKVRSSSYLGGELCIAAVKMAFTVANYTS